MSFIHSTIVGHFDPATLSPGNINVSRAIDVEAAKKLLAEFGKHVEGQVEFRDGFAQCWWADGTIGHSKSTHDYAYRLAELLDCVAAEMPFCQIMYPDDAKQIQAEAWEEWRKQNPLPEPATTSPAVPRRPVPGPVPCPYCGELLRTGFARQCRHCKLDWHDPENLRRLDESRN